MDSDNSHLLLAQQQIADKQGLLDALIQTIPYAVWLRDAEGTFLACNSAYADRWQLSPADIIGKKQESFSDAQTTARALQTDRAAILAGHAISFEQEATSGTAAGIIYEMTKTPMRDASGNLIGVFGMARDISSRKKAEALLRETTERLELAIMGGDLGLWSQNLTGEHAFEMDARAGDILGLTSDDHTYKNLSWMTLVHPDDAPRIHEAMANLMANPTVLYQIEFRARHHQGHWVWLNSRGKVV